MISLRATVLTVQFLLNSKLVLGWFTNSQSRVSCLCRSDVDAIVANWAALFKENSPANLTVLADETVTDNFTATDDSINFLFGVPGQGPYANSKAEFMQNIVIPDPTLTNKTFVALFVEYNCHTITYRWQAPSNAVGPSIAASTE